MDQLLVQEFLEDMECLEKEQLLCLSHHLHLMRGAQFHNIKILNFSERLPMSRRHSPIRETVYQERGNHTDTPRISLSPFSQKLPPSLQPDRKLGLHYESDMISYQYDSTGVFHWCPSRLMEKCLYSRQEMASMVHNNHVVVCLFAEHDSPLIGLRNLIMPLRASNLK